MVKKFLYPCVIASKKEVREAVSKGYLKHVDPSDVWAYPEGYGDGCQEWFIADPELMQPYYERN